MKNFEKIDRYIHDNMPDDEAKAFEAELQNNQELRQEYYLQQAEEAAIKKHAVQELKARMKQYEQEQTDKNLPGKSGFSLKWVVIFGILTLVVVIAVNIQPAEPTENAPNSPPIQVPPANNVPPGNDVPPVNNSGEDEEVTPPPSKALQVALESYTIPQEWQDNYFTRSTGDEPETTPLSNAYLAFEKKQYQIAQNIAKSAVSDMEWGSSARELQAHCLFNLGRFSEAARIFEALIQDKNAFKPHEWQWYLLLCYTAELPATESKYQILLDEILSKEDHNYVQLAEDLKKKNKI